ncbi:MAG: DUF3631 domain-containing protein [Candidatus Limnocylindrales bacterium]
MADAAGGEWPGRARRAALILHADRADDDSLGLRLLADTRLVFDRLKVDRLATATLIEALKTDEESPWVNEHHPLTAERLARYLRPFAIRSKQLKMGGANVRGFLREAFVDSWDRYLPEPATPLQDPLPRYAPHAPGSGVAGYNRGSGSGGGKVDPDELSVEDDYPPSAWGPRAGEDGVKRATVTPDPSARHAVTLPMPSAETVRPTPGTVSAWRCAFDRGTGHVPAQRSDGTLFCATCHPSVADAWSGREVVQ